jgi:cytochrome c551/c552
MRMSPTLGGVLVGLWMCAAADAQSPPRAPAPETEAGRAVFAAKRCDRCHQPRGVAGVGPALEELQRPQGQMELAGRLWNHVPAMASALGQDGLQWPAISAPEMTALMAYLGADPRRDPAPNPSQGQVMLMRKGCLKCHSLAGEGGRVRPDLAARRADYQSAPTWAAAMWTHTPRMAAMAREQGVPYPRFSGSEMTNLVGYLRSAARR